MTPTGRKPLPSKLQTPVWTAVSRGIACFLGIVFLLDLVAIQQSVGADAVSWLLNLEPLPLDAVRVVLAFSGIGLILFSVVPQLPTAVRYAVQAIIALLLCFCAFNTMAAIQAGNPLCLAAFTAILLLLVTPGTLRRTRASRATITPPMHAIFLLTLIQCAITLPLAMILTSEPPSADQLQSDPITIALAFHGENAAPADRPQTTAGPVEQAFHSVDASQPSFVILVATSTQGSDGAAANPGPSETHSPPPNCRVVRPQTTDVSEIVRLMSRLSTETGSRECAAFVPPQISDRLRMEARQAGLRVSIRNVAGLDSEIADADVLLGESVALWRTMLTPICQAVGVCDPPRSPTKADSYAQPEPPVFAN